MALFEQFPYSNFHELNLDWVLKTTRDLIKEWAEYSDNWERWKNDIDNSFKELVEYVNNYFENLDVQNEIDNKINRMAKDGSLLEIIQPVIAEETSKWLDDNIMQETGYVIDKSLTVENAAGDAKAIGDKLGEIEGRFPVCYENLCDNVINDLYIERPSSGGKASFRGDIEDTMGIVSPTQSGNVNLWFKANGNLRNMILYLYSSARSQYLVVNSISIRQKTVNDNPIVATIDSGINVTYEDVTFNIGNGYPGRVFKITGLNYEFKAGEIYTIVINTELSTITPVYSSSVIYNSDSALTQGYIRSGEFFFNEPYQTALWGYDVDIVASAGKSVKDYVLECCEEVKSALYVEIPEMISLTQSYNPAGAGNVIAFNKLTDVKVLKFDNISFWNSQATRENPVGLVDIFHSTDNNYRNLKLLTTTSVNNKFGIDEVDLFTEPGFYYVRFALTSSRIFSANSSQAYNINNRQENIKFGEYVGGYFSLVTQNGYMDLATLSLEIANILPVNKAIRYYHPLE